MDTAPAIAKIITGIPQLHSNILTTIPMLTQNAMQ